MPPFSSASLRSLTCSSLTRPGRSRWPAKHSRSLARSAPRPSSPAPCSPSARPSPRLTPTALVPACAKAAIIQGAAEAYMVESPNYVRPISLIITEALGEERARELRARGADMDWDQAITYTLTQTTQALDELKSSVQI